MEDEYEQIEKLLSAVGSAFVETEDQVNWSAIGKCLQHVLKPVLQKHVEHAVSILYEKLKQSNGIHTQTRQTFLEKHPKDDGYKLIYKNINSNCTLRQNQRNFDYKVKNAVDFSKLFLPAGRIASYQKFDNVCLSAVLTLIINVDEFRGPLSIVAHKVRDSIRNSWAHPDKYTWDNEQTTKCFKRIQQCIMSLRLEEEVESHVIHQVLQLRYEEKSKNEAVKSFFDRSASNHPIAGSSGSRRVGSLICSTCKNATNIQEISTTIYVRQNVDQPSPEDLSEKRVLVIKLYSWLKDEINQQQALCIASQMLKPDHTEVLCQITTRRMTVDGLLKHVLHSEKHINKFLNLLRNHLDPGQGLALDTKIQQTTRTIKREIEACDLANKASTHPENQDVKQWCMREPDKKQLLEKIEEDIIKIDSLNNGLLSCFCFSLADHNNVCRYLKRLDLAGGASCLVETMEQCPRSIMNCFCNTLESLEDTEDVAELLGLREKYCKTEGQGTARGQVVEAGLFSRVLLNLERIRISVLHSLGFNVGEPRLGSILIRLLPLSAYSWENLIRNCLSDNIINVFGDIFFDEQVITWLNTNDRGLLVTIYSEEGGLKQSEVDPDAIVKLELISKDTRASVPFELNEFDSDNPIERSIDLLCEELDICDELITVMRTQELVASDISDKLKETDSRASKIRCFLRSISQPERGYQLLKKYLRISNSYLFQELEKRDKSKVRRKLLFQCEAYLKGDSAERYINEETHAIVLPGKSTTLLFDIWQITKKKCFFEQNGGAVKDDEFQEDNQTEQAEQEPTVYAESTSMVKPATRNTTSNSDKTKNESGGAVKDDEFQEDNQTEQAEQEPTVYAESTSMVKPATRNTTSNSDKTKNESGFYNVAVESGSQTQAHASKQNAAIMSPLNVRLGDPDHNFLVKVALCLQSVKDGLEKFAEDKSRELHDKVVKEVQKLDNISIKGLCPDSEIIFNHEWKTWTVTGCSCQDCTRCIAVIKNQVVKTGQIFLDPNVQILHDKVLQELGSCGNPSISGTCAGAGLRFNRRQNNWEVTNCTCHRCQIFIDEISKYRYTTSGRNQNTRFTFKQSNFNNSDIQQWHTEHWQLAKLFMDPGQDVTTTSPRDTDVSGLLNFIDNCDVPRTEIQYTHYIEKVREGRNSIICTMRLTEAEFLSKTQDMIDLLSDQKCLAHYKESQDAIDMIEKVRSSAFTIPLDNEAKVLQVLAADVEKSNESMRSDIERLITRLEVSERNTLENITRLRADIEMQEESAIQAIGILRDKIKDRKQLKDVGEVEVQMLDILLKDTRFHKQSIASRLDRLECQQYQMQSRKVTIEGHQVMVEGGQVEVEDRQVDIKDRKNMVENRLADLEATVYPSQARMPGISEGVEAKLRQYLKERYNHKIDNPVLSTCLKLPRCKTFAPVILSKDTESRGLEQGSGKIGDSRSPKSLVAEARTSAPRSRTRESENIRSYKAIFFKHNILQKNICVLGKAGIGKSTFCRHLTDIWCRDAKAFSLFDDAEVLKLFRYVFSVSCRFAEASESIFDMICSQLFCENDEIMRAARHALNNTPDECLVLVDGIDEWKGSASTATGRIGDIPGLPSRKELEDCVVLFTSRPERIHMLPVKLDKTCSVLELHGITNSEELILSILEETECPNPQLSCQKFLSQVRQSNMTDLIQSPLMLINALNIWDMNETLSNSMCVNYSHMLEGLFLRAQDANRIEEYAQERRKEISAEIPDCFLHTDLCKQNAGLIIGLGKLAFDLMFRDDQNSSLIFSWQQTREYLTEVELKTSLAIGILTKVQTSSRSRRKIDSFSFCHKTFQEFLGALWLSIEQSELTGIVLRQFRSIDSLTANKVFIQLMCGLSPSAGDRFWKYIAEEVIEKDEEILSCRLKDDVNWTRTKILLLQELVLQCIKEARNSGHDLEHYRQLYYIIPDIYIDKCTDNKDIALIYGMMEKFSADIKSIALCRKRPSEIVKLMKKIQSAITVELLGDDEISWSTSFSDSEEVPLLQFPHQLKILSMVNLVITTSAVELPLHLRELTVANSKLSHSSIEQLFSCLRVSSSLRHLRLERLHCSVHGDSCCLPALDLQRHHTLEKVELKRLSVESVLLPGQMRLQTTGLYRKPTLIMGMYKVNMSPQCWRRWIDSLPHRSYRLKVNLEDCNLDEDSKLHIRSCADFKVARDSWSHDWFSFKTKQSR